MWVRTMLLWLLYTAAMVWAKRGCGEVGLWASYSCSSVTFKVAAHSRKDSVPMEVPLIKAGIQGRCHLTLQQPNSAMSLTVWQEGPSNDCPPGSRQRRFPSTALPL